MLVLLLKTRKNKDFWQLALGVCLGIGLLLASISPFQLWSLCIIFGYKFLLPVNVWTSQLKLSKLLQVKVWFINFTEFFNLISGGFLPFGPTVKQCASTAGPFEWLGLNMLYIQPCYKHVIRRRTLCVVVATSNSRFFSRFKFQVGYPI